MLAPTNQEIKIYPPSKLENPFTTEEIIQAASKLKNGKSAGCDGTQAEYIKYGYLCELILQTNVILD